MDKYVIIGDKLHRPKFNPLSVVGERYNYLTAISFLEYRVYKNGHIYPFLLWSCECGKTAELPYQIVRKGDLMSCGCRSLMGKRSASAARRHPLYGVWAGVKARCYTKKNSSYGRYGAKGIGVCDEWRYDFSAFAQWCQDNGYQKGLHLDRIDGGGDYSPENCRCVEPAVNHENRRNILKIEYNGRLMTTRDLAAISNGVPYPIITTRIRALGWSVEKAINTPVKKRILKQS